MDIFEKKNVGVFLGGMIASFVGKQLLKSPKTREYAVETLAKGMKLQKDAYVYLQNMKEDAEDICYEARDSAN